MAVEEAKLIEGWRQRTRRWRLGFGDKNEIVFA
jgi:hypothetical protein